MLLLMGTQYTYCINTLIYKQYKENNYYGVLLKNIFNPQLSREREGRGEGGTGRGGGVGRRGEERGKEGRVGEEMGKGVQWG